MQPAPVVAASKDVTLRGLNVQFPFSRLLRDNVKTQEIRRFPLGHRGIAWANERLFLIETPAKRAGGAILGELDLGPPPASAQVVAILSFSHDTQFVSPGEFRASEEAHRVAHGGAYDWDGASPCFAWHVQSVQKLLRPVPAGSKTMTGYGTPRTLRVELETEDLSP